MKADLSDLFRGPRPLDRAARQPRLDIVIVNWNAGPLLGSCVESILAARTDGLVLGRIAVVDNFSSDGSADFPASFRSRVELRRNPANLGFATACNQGAAGSDADYLLFLNPDIILDPDTLVDALAFMEAEANREIDISGIRLRGRDGGTQRCCARFPTPGRAVGQALGLDRAFPRLSPPHFMTDWDHEDSRDVPQVMGAFLLIRRPAFERLGGFDERFFLYYEDVDLCYRLALAGGRCAHNAKASAVHIGGGTTAAIKARRQFLSAQSRILYFRKHYGRVGAALVGAAALICEPLARIGLGAARRSTAEAGDAILAATLLWRSLPAMLMGRRRAKRKLRVLALTRYGRLGASSRTRFHAYLPALDAADVEVAVSPFFDDDYLERLYGGKRRNPGAILFYYLRRIAVLCRGSHDLLWIEKEMLPWVPLAVELLLLRNRPFVLDVDDAWFLRYAANPARSLLGAKLDGLVRLARATIVGNAFLAGWAQGAGAGRVVELPTTVSFERYRPMPQHPVGGPLRIGWIGTPNSAAQYLRPLVPVLAEAVRQGWASVTVVGARDSDLAAIGGVTFLPWSEAREVEFLHGFDVGIMPLTGDAWSQGKCAYKLIQYMAVGLPVVASPVGMNRDVVEDGVNGFHATTAEEWLRALRILAEDAELRRRMGAAGRRIAEARYALSPIGPRLVETLRDAAGWQDEAATPTPPPARPEAEPLSLPLGRERGVIRRDPSRSIRGGGESDRDHRRSNAGSAPPTA